MLPSAYQWNMNRIRREYELKHKSRNMLDLEQVPLDGAVLEATLTDRSNLVMFVPNQRFVAEQIMKCV